MGCGRQPPGDHGEDQMGFSWHFTGLAGGILSEMGAFESKADRRLRSEWQQGNSKSQAHCYTNITATFSFFIPRAEESKAQEDEGFA